MVMSAGISSNAFLGGSALGALGSIGSGLISGALAGASAKQAYHHQRDLMNLQAKLNYKYAKKSTLNQYSWQRQGLEAAGYNPLLALNGAEGVANTGWTSAQSAPQADYSQAVNSAMSFQDMIRQNKLAANEIKTGVYNRGLIAEQIRGQEIENQYGELMKESELALNNVETYLKNAQLLETVERTKWIAPSAKAEITKLIKGNQSDIMQANASITSAKAQTTMAGANAEEQRLRAKWIKEHPYLYGIERAGAGFAAMAGAGIGAGYGIKSMFTKKKPVGFRTK